MQRLVHPLLCLALVCAYAKAETREAFTIDQIMSAPFAAHLVAAPKGSAVSWVINASGKRNVWAAEGPNWTGHRLTQFDRDDGQEIDELCWTPDGSHVLFTRGGDFETGGAEPNPAASPQKPGQDVWKVGLDGSAPKKLAEGHAPALSPSGDTVAFVRAGQIYFMKPTGENVEPVVYETKASGLRWSPDGTSLAFVSQRKNHSFIGVYGVRDKSLRYLDASTDSDSNPIWSADGEYLAYIRIPSTIRAFAFGPEREGEPWSIRIAEVQTGRGREIFHAERGPGSVFHRLASPEQLFWTASNRVVFPWERTGWSHLYSVADAGSSKPIELTPGDGEVENATLSSDRQHLVYSTNIGDIDRRHVNELRMTGSDASVRPVTTGEGIEVEPVAIGEGNEVVFLQSAYNESLHAAVRLASGQVKALAPGTTPAEFPAAALVKPQAMMITAADGLQIHGQVFAPRGSGDVKRPALIFFHGGSRRQMLLGFHYMYYYSNAYSLEQYLASRGYLVLSVNYRSGIGYGLNFREALNYGATGASEYNDVIGAALYLKNRPDVDPKQVGVWGGSYGGYLTALGLARGGDLFKAGVDFHGVHDWNQEIENFVPAYNPKDQADAAKVAWNSSPLASVAGWRSPVLLIHGDDDRNVPFIETIQLAEELRRRHVHFEELIFPDEVHDFLLHEHWVAAYKATAEFFERQIPTGQAR